MIFLLELRCGTPFGVCEERGDDLVSIARWRNKTMPSLRSVKKTPELLGKQVEWVRSFKDTEHYYLIIDEKSTCCGYCGLDKIDSHNRTAEISCLIRPDKRMSGYGKEAVCELLEKAFFEFRVELVYGEVYSSTSAVSFWKKCGFSVEAKLRQRKFWMGHYYDSHIISITEDEWKQSLSQTSEATTTDQFLVP